MLLSGLFSFYSRMWMYAVDLGMCAIFYFFALSSYFWMILALLCILLFLCYFKFTTSLSISSSLSIGRNLALDFDWYKHLPNDLLASLASTGLGI